MRVGKVLFLAAQLGLQMALVYGQSTATALRVASVSTHLEPKAAIAMPAGKLSSCPGHGPYFDFEADSGSGVGSGYFSSCFKESKNYGHRMKPTTAPAIDACPETKEWQEIANGWATMLNGSSPLALTLVGAAILEEQVLQTLRKTIPEIETKRDAITHGLRVFLLREMGIITNPIAKSLMAYATIRNRFAHQPHTTTFDDAEVVKSTKKLEQQLESETGGDWKSTYTAFHEAMDKKYCLAGGQNPWKNEVARTLVTAYLPLSFYLVWARHLAPSPMTPKNINEIGRHQCHKTEVNHPDARKPEEH